MKNILFIAVAILFSLNLMAQQTYIHAGKLIDTKNSKVLEERTIIVDGNKISSVEKGFK